MRTWTVKKQSNSSHSATIKRTHMLKVEPGHTIVTEKKTKTPECKVVLDSAQPSDFVESNQ